MGRPKKTTENENPTIEEMLNEARKKEADAKNLRRDIDKFWSDIDRNINQIILYINSKNLSDTFGELYKAYGADTEHKKAALRNHLLSENQVNYFNRIYKPDAPISERGTSGSNSVERVSSPVGVVGGTPAEVE